MDAKSQLKKLIAGEIPPLTDGIYTDGKKIYKVTGAIGIYSKMIPEEDVSKLRPISILNKLNQGNTVVYLPDNGRE